MGGNIKICYRTEFQRISRALTIDAGSDEVTTITVSRSDNAKLLRLKNFTDYNEAMNYYFELFDNLKSAEERETRICPFKMPGLYKEKGMISIAYQTEFTLCNRLVCIYAYLGGTGCVRVRRTDTYEVEKEVTDVGAGDAIELYEKLVNLYAKREKCRMPCCTR